MAGHSKWANIKHRKSRMDEQKGKIFTKLSREIAVAAREGGSDIQSNFRLRIVVQKAKEANMPNDNIQRNIQKGLGNIEGVSYESVTYEGYGSGGTAVLVEALTDNRNRTVAEIRHIFSKNGGNLGEAGCVAWIFERKGYLTISNEDNTLDEDDIMLDVIEAGAEDFRNEENYFEIITAPEDMEKVRDSIQQKEINISSAEITMLPKTTLKIEDTEEAQRVLKLMSLLEDHDDVQSIHANFDISENLQLNFD